MKKFKIFFIISFVFILVFPTISYPFLKKFDKELIDENRVKAEFPRINSEFFSNFNKYFDDNLPFRGTYIKLFNKFETRIDFVYKNLLDAFNIPYYIEKNNVIFGKEDWLFYYYGDNNSHYSGFNLPTIQELEGLSQKLNKINNYFKSRNKDFLLFIAPNKEEIYFEYMPDAIKVVNETKRLDIIVDYIQKNTDVKIVYPKNELLKAKEKGLLYYKYDTHWNNLGGYIGASTILEKLNIEYDKSAEYTTVDRWGGDLLTMIAESVKKDTEYNVNYKQDVELSISGNDVISSNENGKELLYFGDSFRKAMINYLGKEFYKSKFNHFNDYYTGSEFKEFFNTADTIIFECVGRYESEIYLENGMLDRFIRLNNL